MPTFRKFKPIFILVIPSNENDLLARKGTERRRAFFDIEAVFHVLTHVEAIPNHRDDIGPVLVHRFGKICIKLPTLVQICDRQDRDLSYFDFLTAHTVTSMRLASDSSFDFR